LILRVQGGSKNLRKKEKKNERRKSQPLFIEARPQRDRKQRSCEKAIARPQRDRNAGEREHN